MIGEPHCYNEGLIHPWLINLVVVLCQSTQAVTVRMVEKSTNLGACGADFTTIILAATMLLVLANSALTETPFSTPHKCASAQKAW